MKYFLILTLALGFAAPTFAEDDSTKSEPAKAAPTKKAPKKALKKVPPSEPVAPPTPSPEPTVAPETTSVTPAPAPAETPAPAPALVENDGRHHGMFGDFKVGPSVTLLGFPTPFRFGAEAKYGDLIGLSLDWGFFPTLALGTAKLGFTSWRIGAQVYPFQGSFYLGLGFGKQNLDGSMVKDTGGTSVTYTLKIATTILTPHIGWRWLSASGFFYGMELGAQLAADSAATFSSNAPAGIQALPEYSTNKADIEKQGKDFGQTTLPAFALVQMGWMF